MNSRTLAAATRALDAAISREAAKQFVLLRNGLDPEETAKAVHDSLRSLDRLRSGRMPNYDSWDALFYSLWYQPAHINLAYTLSKLIPREQNPLKSGSGSLQVVDFGCGALAMLFGLVLAATDTLQKLEALPRIAIVSEDTSQPMKDIGWSIWDGFVEEVAKNPELRSLLQVCQDIQFHDQDSSDAIYWLTALHVAYRENVHKEKIREGLDAKVKKYDPSLVLITTHPENIQSAYSLEPSTHDKQEKLLSRPSYKLDGTFRIASTLRSNLYRESIGNLTDLPDYYDWDFVRLYLRRYDTAWVTSPRFDSHSILYTRR